MGPPSLTETSLCGAYLYQIGPSVTSCCYLVCVILCTKWLEVAIYVICASAVKIN